MKQAVPLRKQNQVFHLHLERRIAEAFAIVFAALAVYFFISLITYNVNDPGWTLATVVRITHNSGGKVGAWLSDFFFCLFGYMAYLFPFVFLLTAWLLFRDDSPESAGLWHETLRAVGFFLALTSGTSFLHIHSLHWMHAVRWDSGGILGKWLGGLLVGIFNPSGTNLFLVAMLLIGVTWLTGVSWIGMSQWLGRQTWRGLQWLYAYYQDQKEEWLNRKEAPKATRRYERRVEKEEPAPIPVAPKKPIIVTVPQPVKIEKPAKKATNAPKDKTDGSGSLLPSVTLLNEPPPSRRQEVSSERLEHLSKEVETKLADFDIQAKVVAVHPGPIITRFELELAPGIKVSKITPLAKDLARALSQSSVRIVEVIPGKAVIGLEIPNEIRDIVSIREMFESQAYQDFSAPLGMVLGKDISGYPVIVDLEKMPHVLVAGTTGSGKSVSLNVMILSILFKRTAEDVRLIMVDPKMLELSVYEGIPHLLTPVVTDMREAANAFRWCVAEMDKRYRLMASLGVRNLQGYNAKVKQSIKDEKPIPDPTIPQEIFGENPVYLKPLPYIVLIVDELADMMMVVGKKVEELIARIAQKARAAGIHMILATQRPSVDVITGLIKANIPTRISFQVSSRIDSRTILDQQGAEQLLGHGDMLYLPPGTAHPTRVHGAFISDEEVHRVVADLKTKGEPEYMEEILSPELDAEGGNGNGSGEVGSGEKDPLYDQAVQIVVESRRASISYIQRRLKIGYNRAASMLEEMERAGIVSGMETNGSREILVPGGDAEE